ncbi:MAG TPA: hypothetical protein VFT40_09060 [Sphingomicrobium sp.]|nr:hypothetical protein [Sphingomicrobium sp.]
MVVIPGDEDIMACGHAGSRRAVIAVAPAAEPVPADRIITSLGPTTSGASRSHVTARAARAVDQARRERAARRARSGCARMGPLTVMAR